MRAMRIIPGAALIWFAQAGFAQVPPSVDIGLQLSISSIDSVGIGLAIEVSNAGRDEYPGGALELEVFDGVQYEVFEINLLPVPPDTSTAST